MATINNTPSNIEFNNMYGTYSFVENTRNSISWHRLGQKFDEPLTAVEAIDACNANYNVSKQPIAVMNQEVMDYISNGLPVPADLLKDLFIKGKKATVRDDSDTALGIVSDSYGVVQNADAFTFLDKIVSGELRDNDSSIGDTPIIECAGVLGEGEKVFVTVKFPNSIKLDSTGEDRIDMYLVFTTAHDGSGAVKCMVTPVRVASNAALNLSIGYNGGKISMRHSSNVMKRMDLTNLENAKMAYESLNLFSNYCKKFEETIETLKNKVLTMEQVEDIVAKVIMSDEQFKIWKEFRNLDADGISTNAKNKFNKAINNIFNGIGQSTLKQYSGFWVINGLATLYQNGFKPTNSEVFFNSVTDGYIYNKIQKAYQAILTA